MELGELRREKKELEKRLADVIRPLLSRFERHTDFSVRDISTNFVEFTSFGDARKKYSLTSVEVDLEEI